MVHRQVQIHRKISNFNITDTLKTMNVGVEVLIKNTEATTEMVRNSISRLKSFNKKSEIPEMKFFCTSVKEKMPSEFRKRCDTYVKRIE